MSYRIAFFDFDGTIVNHNSFIGFAKFCMGKTAVCKACLMTMPSILLWKLGVKSNSYAKQRLFSHLFKGMDYEDFKTAGTGFVSLLKRDLRPDFMNCLRHHKERGDRLIIVSASIADWIRPLAVNMGITDVIATEVEVDDYDKLTGRFRTPNCNGEEKVKRIRSLIPDLDKYETWAYGDSKGDDAMLALVHHPVKLSHIS